MTNQEINLKIAEIKGIKASIINDEVHSLYEDDSRCDLLDYINDWNLLGPLVLELVKAGWILCFNTDGNYQWVKNNPVAIYNGCVTHSETLGKATCLAYIKEFGDG